MDEQKGQSASEQEILSNLSIGMALTLSRAFGSQSMFHDCLRDYPFVLIILLLFVIDPPVVKAILQTLLDGLVMYKPLSLKLTPGLKNTLDSIQMFAKEVLCVSNDTGKNSSTKVFSHISQLLLFLRS
mgnify:CR=1 FL=1